ncbi:MAG: hypothetical protein WC551_08335 [Patescibacteria group bacterium]
MKCLGCDRAIPWNGEGAFCYTCPCGATVFYRDEPTTLMMPMSLSRYLMVLHRGLKGPAPGHIDRYVGTSPHTSQLKSIFVEFLQHIGLVWMKDCPQCQQDGTLSKMQKREAYLAVKEAEKIMRAAGGG